MSNCDCHHGSTVGGFLKGIVWGGIIGAGVALLLTPNSGEENRKELKKKGKELGKKAKRLLEDASESLEINKDEIKKKVEDVSNVLEKKMEEVTSFLDEDRVKNAVSSAQDFFDNTKQVLDDTWRKKAEPVVRHETQAEKDEIEEDEVELARKILSRAAGRSFYKKSNKK